MTASIPETWAISNEIDSAVSLLNFGVATLRNDRLANIDSDPILLCLSCGAEKLMKLNLGLAGIKDNNAWPSKKTMKEYGHSLTELHDACLRYIKNNIERDVPRPYIEQLLQRVESDEILAGILAALECYAERGRFYNLDELAQAHQQQPSPRQLWEDVEQQIISADERLAVAFMTAEAQRAKAELNNKLCGPIESMCTLYWRSWQNHVFGEAGRHWSTSIGRLPTLPNREN